MLKDEKGQALIEFTFAFLLLCMLIFGLIGVAFWGTGSFFAQEVARDAARKYAVTMNGTTAKEQGQKYLNKYAYIFIKPGKSTIRVWRKGTNAYSEVTVIPRIQDLYVYKMKSITKESSCTMEHVFREPGKYSL
jgi:Flp pilus assembly protein TadG